MKRRAWLVCLLLAACVSPPQYRGTWLDPPLPIEPFALIDPAGNSVTLPDPGGRTAVVSFGYTYCPDVCPATLSIWKQAAQELGPLASGIDFVMITVDPKRDTAERLRSHLGLFDERFIGLTGDDVQLETAYEAFGVFRKETRFASSEMGYLVDHSSRTWVVDRHGIRLSWSFGTQAADLAHDLRLLADASPPQPRLRVEQAWSRPTPSPPSGPGVVYLKLANDAVDPLRLVGASSEVCERVEIHRSAIVDDRMTMEPVEDGVEIPAGGELELAPGGYHLMLIGLHDALAAGEAFDLRLAFDGHPSLVAPVVVREP